MTKDGLSQGHYRDSLDTKTLKDEGDGDGFSRESDGVVSCQLRRKGRTRAWALETVGKVQGPSFFG